MKRLWLLVISILPLSLVLTACSPLDPIDGSVYFENIETERIDMGEAYVEGPVQFVDDGQIYRRYTLTPDYDIINTNSAPTNVVRGANRGFSLPVGGVDEKLYYDYRVPYEWDGESDFELYVYCWLSDAQPLGTEFFKLQAEYGHYTPDTDTIPNTMDIVEGEEMCADAVQYQSYRVWLSIPYDGDEENVIENGDMLSIIISRANHEGGIEATGEIIIDHVEIVVKWWLLGSTVHW